jgi:hypothetical protein
MQNPPDRGAITANAGGRLLSQLSSIEQTLAFQLNTAVWRHHVDGRSWNCADTRYRKLNGDVVNVKV